MEEEEYTGYNAVTRATAGLMLVLLGGAAFIMVDIVSNGRLTSSREETSG